MNYLFFNLVKLQVAVRGVLKYCIRGMLGDEQRQTVILFMDAIAALCAPSQDAAKIEHLKEQVNVALAQLERDFPLSLSHCKTDLKLLLCSFF